MATRTFIAACGALLVGVPASALAQQQDTVIQPMKDCAALTGKKFGQARITSGVVQPANDPVEGATIPDFTVTAGNQPMSGLPEFCMVSGTMSAAPDSNMKFEVWLPTKGWDDRFTGANNGGLAGYVNYLDLAAALRASQVGASIDTGHSNRDSSEIWAKEHPERVKDYAWRSIHLMTVTAKAVIDAYFGRAPRQSYFVGCSNGGQQGLIEAARYPEDYDAIVVGAPAARVTESMMSVVNVAQALSKPEAMIRSDQVKFLQSEVRVQCDALDGSKDGLLDNPSQCKSDYARLGCRISSSAQCFSTAELAALRPINDGGVDSKGRLVAHGFGPNGAEAGARIPFFGWEGTILRRYVTPGQRTLAASVLEDLPARAISSEDGCGFDRDARRFRSALAKDLDATPDLRRFFARGGKMLMFHGWADPVLPPEATVDFHAQILRRSGPVAAGNLRWSTMILDAQGFRAVVKEEALKPNGMPPFPQLQDADREAIRHYLRLRAMQLPAYRVALRAGVLAAAGTSPRPRH